MDARARIRAAPPRRFLLRLDGALLDSYRLVHGCLEDKDDADDLAAEMGAKLKLGYRPKTPLLATAPCSPRAGRQGRPDLPLVPKPASAPGQPRRGSRRLSATPSRARRLGARHRRVPGAFARAGPQRTRPHPEGPRPIAPNRKFVAAFDAFTTLCRTAINRRSPSKPSRRC